MLKVNTKNYAYFAFFFNQKATKYKKVSWLKKWTMHLFEPEKMQ